MIPTQKQVRALWEKYQLPENKRRHVMLVARVARFLVQQCNRVTKQQIDEDLLLAVALLHDIDKNAPKRAGERHPDAAVRILREEGMDEVAQLVKTHPLHAILDPAIAPKTLPEKLLYLADKMVKYDIVGVDKRFALWRQENVPPDAAAIVEAAYPRVKALEEEIFSMIGISPDEALKLA